MTGPTHTDANMKHVGIVGLGTIGKRVASAVALQPDMVVSGFAAPRMTPYLASAASRVPIYHIGKADSDATIVDAAAGEICDLIKEVDVIIDCAPRGRGAERRALYRKWDVPVVFQGGEAAQTSDVSFCASVNFEAARDQSTVRVVSCNTTGVARVFSVLYRVAGPFAAKLIFMRSAADPDKVDKGSATALTAEAGYSHHADDLRGFWPAADIASIALKGPTNRGHLVAGFLTFQARPDAAALLKTLAHTPRIVVAAGEPSTAIMRHVNSSDRRHDCHSVIVWADAFSVRGFELVLTLGIHMEAIVIPDTIDAIRAMLDPSVSAEECMALTNRVLGVPSGVFSLFPEESKEPC